MQKQYSVYIVTNRLNTVLYTGVTSDLQKRIYEHKNKIIPGFTSKYNVNKLVYYDTFSSPQEAISAEKKIKGWTRVKKINLIKQNNPEFRELSE
ncbi:MAG: GIY-YIG nuclease family protein [Patescibacteria group bacterium]|nr:GIY-YIG nuclease family protein [Patescibacteria group bacterium]